MPDADDVDVMLLSSAVWHDVADTDAPVSRQDSSALGDSGTLSMLSTDVASIFSTQGTSDGEVDTTGSTSSQATDESSETVGGLTLSSVLRVDESSLEHGESIKLDLTSG